MLIAIVLCCTGVGAIIGIPMLIVGWKEQYKRTKDVIQGNCPYCATLINVSLESQAANCAICQKRIIVRDGYFYSI